MASVGPQLTALPLSLQERLETPLAGTRRCPGWPGSPRRPPLGLGVGVGRSRNYPASAFPREDFPCIRVPARGLPGVRFPEVKLLNQIVKFQLK